MIGDKIKERRLELGMTQHELALKVGYKSRSAINKIELGKVDVNQKLLVQLSNALQVSPLYFLEDDLPPELYNKKHLLYYAMMLSGLNDRNRDSAIQYIKYLSDAEKQQEQK